MGCSRSAEPPAEQVLHGGTANRGLVVRVGDTVRRPARATSGSTRALLDHLDAVGFNGAPRYLGTDDSGREVLTFVPGQTVSPPYPSWVLSDAALLSVARLLREFHAAASTFDARPYRWARPVPAPFRTGLVTHNDPNLQNVVFRDGRAVALIDFDLASPGSRVWEVAAAARLWAPLRDDADIDDIRRGSALSRLRTFVDAYDLNESERSLLPRAVLANHDWLYKLVAERAADGHDAFSAYWWGGAAARARRSRAWVLRRQGAIVAVQMASTAAPDDAHAAPLSAPPQRTSIPDQRMDVGSPGSKTHPAAGPAS